MFLICSCAFFMPRGSWQCLTNFQHLPLSTSHSVSIFASFFPAESIWLSHYKSEKWPSWMLTISCQLLILHFHDCWKKHLEVEKPIWKLDHPLWSPEAVPNSPHLRLPHPQLSTADGLQAPFQQSKSGPSFVHGGKHLDMDRVHNKNPERSLKYQKQGAISHLQKWIVGGLKSEYNKPYQRKSPYFGFE